MHCVTLSETPLPPSRLCPRPCDSAWVPWVPFTSHTVTLFRQSYLFLNYDRRSYLFYGLEKYPIRKCDLFQTLQQKLNQNSNKAQLL